MLLVEYLLRLSIYLNYGQKILCIINLLRLGAQNYHNTQYPSDNDCEDVGGMMAKTPIGRYIISLA